MRSESSHYFGRPKFLLIKAGAVAKPHRASFVSLARRPPGGRPQPGDSVPAADKAIRSERYNAQILPLLAMPAPRHGALRIHGRLRAASAVARVVLPAAWIRHELSVACASRSRGPGWYPRPRYPIHRLSAA